MPSSYEISVNDLVLNTLQDSMYFENIDKYEYDKGFYNVVAEILDNWIIFRDRIFFNCFPNSEIDLLKFGWKIHVSCTSANAKEILSIVAEICKEYSVSFKFLMDSNLRDMSTEKSWSRSSAGKFITIYPTSKEEFVDLVECLYKKLMDFDGPYILTDKRYKDCKVLFYRYGSIRPDIMQLSDGREFEMLESPDGKKEVDDRQPFFHLPDWVEDPFIEDQTLNDEENLTLKDGRYSILGVLHFSATGGVYLAIDNTTKEKVAIKEARPFTRTTNYSDKDAVSYIHNEYDNLKTFSNSIYTPDAIELFHEWEHTFLVEEYIEGIPLTEYAPTKGIILIPEPKKEDEIKYNKEVESICLNIAYAVKSFHDKSYIINDLSPNNIIIDEEKHTVKIIDIEAAHHINNRGNEITFTPGFSHKDISKKRDLDFEIDLYALGTVFFQLLMPGASFKDLQPDFFKDILARLEKEYSLPKKVLFLIENLTNYTNTFKSIEEIINFFENGDTPDTSFYSNKREIPEIIERTHKQILLNSDINSKSTIFKTSPLKMNNYNIEHGDIGIIYALNYIGLNVDDKNKYTSRILSKLKKDSENILPGLYNGKSGIAWALNELDYVKEGKEEIYHANEKIFSIKNYSVHSGLAGNGLANLYFYLEYKDKYYLEQAIKVAQVIIDNKDKDTEKGLFWRDEFNSTYNGYLNGSSGIALLFLYLYKITGKEEYLNFAKKSIDYDINQIKYHHGNVASLAYSEDQGSLKVSPYFDSGSAGLLTVLCRLIKYDSNVEDKYINFFDELIIDCQRIFAVYPTLFLGMAGLGNFMLDYYQILGVNKALDFAYKIAETIKIYDVDIRDGESGFPGVHLIKISNDFATGSSGVILFLDRLINNKHNFNFTIDHLF